MYNYLTEKSVQILKDELEHRKNVVRFQINEELKEARAHGDLSENFEYKAAKKNRADNNRRMGYLEKMIKTAKIINDDISENQVGVGKIVTLRFLDDDEEEDFTMVTTVEADPLNNKISIECPLGKALYKRNLGEKAEVTSPDGSYSVVIEKLEMIK
ncbi:MULTISPECIES: transcription elongation factor GreA [unclassified Clostridium]|uniref:transcription elongation factor GreA n=1 Tax=unclassified Clostridium TaxID=2614128 RepID=UPI00321793EB